MRRRSRSVVARIIEAGLLDEGTLFTVAPDTQVTPEIRDSIDAWVVEDPARGQARWVNANPRCLVWAVDGQEYSASGLAEHIIREASGHAASITGPTWWADETGLRLRDLLINIPAGRWASYKDLADAIGSSPIAVGQHITRCGECERGDRVLSSRDDLPGVHLDRRDPR